MIKLFEVLSNYDFSVFWEYKYVYKEAFWLFLLIPIFIIWHIYKLEDNSKNIQISSVENFGKKRITFWSVLKHFNFFILLIGFSLAILSLAKPQDENDIEEYKKKNIEGIDIVLSIDVSGSMLAEDFKPNRLESAKKTAEDFISERPNDRIGLVVYEGEAYTQAPLTNDHSLLIDLLEKVKTGMVAQGTAIGAGLITSVNRLRESTAKSKVIILLTDGVNNTGDIDPVTAAQIANEFGIRVYTIGVGKNGTAPYPVKTMFGTSMQQMPVEIDEDLLVEIAEITGGEYFRAENDKELELIYEQIDKLEKSKVKVIEFRTDPPDKYYSFLFLGILFILSSKIIENTLLRGVL